MIGATLYIISCTFRNRIRVRLRRLREPRYLIGAVVGIAYFYFTFFARFRTQQTSAARRRARGAPSMPADFAAIAAAGPAIGGLAMMLLAALAWVFPFDSGLLDFSEPEVQFLFPAPVSRRWLLVHRLLRSQLGMLFGAVVTGLVMPSASGVSRLQIAVGMWLLLCIGKLYFTGVTLSRARVTSSDFRVSRVARLPLIALAAAFVVVARAAYGLFAEPLAGPADLMNRLAGLIASGPSRWATLPFVAVVRPLFADSGSAYFAALAGAAAILAACLAWVLASDQTFYEATQDVAQARQKEAGQPRQRYRSGVTAWTLRPSGGPEAAFAWKAALQTFRVVDVRVMIRVTALILAVSFAAASVGRRSGLVGAFAAFALAGTAFSLLLGPQAIRIDLRQDLEHLDLIKTWPLRPADVVRGEMLWPGVLITALAWIMIALATILSGVLFTRLDTLTRLGLGGAAMIVAPGLAFAQLAIHNGVALLFPAWVSLGSQRGRGFDAMGQRIIMLGGTLLALIVMALPAAIAAGVVWFAFRYFIGVLAVLPAAMVCTGILLAEVLVMTEMLGPAFERLDVLAVERAE